jgi:tetratricopeptide (TPR) repeat protein
MYYVSGGETGILTMFAQSLILRDGIARASAAQGKLDDAIATYRRLLVVDRSSKWSAFFEPRYVLALARLLDRAGRRDEAKAEYLRFLGYWKDADPGQPELVEAIRRTR